MSYCKITGASCGINIESASPTIQWTWINNCGGGIGVYGGGPTLINNTIAYNTGYGLNSIVFSNVFMGYNKNNIIAQCISGINAYSYGTVYAYQGNNSIHDNHNGTYEVTASSGGNVQADYNWWGQSSPPSSWFYQGLGGTISYNNALDSDPNSGRSLYKQVTIPISSNRVISQSSSTEDELNQAYKFWQEKQYNSTIEKCKSILSTNPVSTIAYPALSLLRLAAQEIKDSDIETYLQNAALANEKNEFGGVALLNHSYYLLFKGQYSSALSMLDFAINKYKNTDIEKAAMFQKILTLFNHLKDDKTGEEELARFESKYTDDDLVKELRRLINRPDLPKFSQKQSKQSSSNDDIVNDEELSNYPNPFNPTTNIVFRIADVGFVTLKIYDILGREVTALVDEVKAPGKYVIPFNADKLSSGTYYYRLIITPSNGEKEIIQQRAMQVIK
jgi:tetratricopeptide (TPR) repeat protein